jgi:hypothetical protein
MLCLIRVARMTGHNCDGRHTVRCCKHCRICSDRVRCSGKVVPIIPQHSCCHFARVNEEAARDR